MGNVNPLVRQVTHAVLLEQAARRRLTIFGPEGLHTEWRYFRAEPPKAVEPKLSPFREWMARMERMERMNYSTPSSAMRNAPTSACSSTA